MPKLIGRPPKYCHHKASNRAYVRIEGRSIYLGIFDSAESWEQYHRLITAYLANGRRLPPEYAPHQQTKPEGLLVKQLILAYWEWAKGYYHKPSGEPTSEVNSLKQALKVLRQHFGSEPAGTFGPRKLKVVREAMIQKGWCRKSVNGQVSRIKGMFRWATEEELIPSSVYHGLLAVRTIREGRRPDVPEPEPVEPVAIEHVEQVLPFLSPPVAAMVRLQLLTAMRPGEVVTMTTGQIDRSDREVWVYRLKHHKTAHHGKTREVALGPKAQELIRPFLRLSPDQPLFSPSDAERDRLERRHLNRTTPLNQGNRPGYTARVRASRAACAIASHLRYSGDGDVFDGPSTAGSAGDAAGGAA